MSDAAVQARETPKRTAAHSGCTKSMSENDPNSFLLHAGRRMESAMAIGGGNAPKPNPIIGGHGSPFICGGAA